MKYIGEIIGKGIALGGGSAIGHSIVEALRTPLTTEKVSVKVSKQETHEDYCALEAKLFTDCMKNEELVSSCINLLKMLQNCENNHG